MDDDGVTRRAVLLSCRCRRRCHFVVALHCVDVVLALDVKTSSLDKSKPIQHEPTPTPLLPPHSSSLLSLTCLLISNQTFLWSLCVTTGSADLTNLCVTTGSADLEK